MVYRLVLLKKINVTYRGFGGVWYHGYSFSSLAKSILSRFLPILPSNCTSTNSVFCSISLFRMVPLPNTLCRTLSPGLYCCSFGAGGVGGVGGCDEGVFCDGAGVTFFAAGEDGGT